MPVKGLYAPPFAVILRLLNLGEESSAIPHDKPVVVPLGLLRFLLRGMVASMPFDEELYLRTNTDVAKAMLCGDIASAQDHFVTNGYFEGRDGAGEEFAEDWYLRTNPDVAEGITAGTWQSPYDHYRTEGVFELRSPNARAELGIASWRRCFSKTVREPETAKDTAVERETVAGAERP
jgi:hypothetical protein